MFVFCKPFLYIKTRNGLKIFLSFSLVLKLKMYLQPETKSCKIFKNMFSQVFN